MPELPEVETVRRNLAQLILGRAVVAISQPTHPRTLRKQDGALPGLCDSLRGRYFTEAARRGKFLWLTLSAEPGGEPLDEVLLFHLGMSGQLRVLSRDTGGEVLAAAGSASSGVQVPGEEQLAHERIRLILADGTQLVFCDQRTFGYVASCGVLATADGKPGGAGTVYPRIPVHSAHIARDVLDPYRDPRELEQKLRSSQRAVKTKLLDQSVIAGVGNIYADEALFAAGLHPARPAKSLSAAAVARLDEALQTVMTQALEFGGTSFDQLYVDTWGNPGEFASELQAYGRAGKACRLCATVMERLVLAQRTSVFCPKCQAENKGISGKKPKVGHTASQKGKEIA